MKFKDYINNKMEDWGINRSFFSKLIFSLFIMFIAWFGVVNADLFGKHSSLILILVTMFYAFSSYELLRATEERGSKAYLLTTFFIVANVDDDFIEENKGFFKDERELSKIKEGVNKNVVFAKVKNVGEASAIDVVVNVFNDRVGGGSDQEGAKNKVDFGLIEKGERVMRVVSIFQDPTKGDVFKIKKVMLEYNDLIGKITKSKKVKKDITREVEKKVEDGVVINFDNSEN